MSYTLVSVAEKNKTARICGDFEGAINRLLEPQKYTLPKTEDIFTDPLGDSISSKYV